jgi:hypothetical protein
MIPIHWRRRIQRRIFRWWEGVGVDEELDEGGVEFQF